MSVPDAAMGFSQADSRRSAAQGAGAGSGPGAGAQALPMDAEGQPPRVAASGHLCLKVERVARVEPRAPRVFALWQDSDLRKGAESAAVL